MLLSAFILLLIQSVFCIESQELDPLQHFKLKPPTPPFTWPDLTAKSKHHQDIHLKSKPKESAPKQGLVHKLKSKQVDEKHKVPDQYNVHLVDPFIQFYEK